MKSFSLLVVGLLSTAVAADPHNKHKKHNGTKHGGECRQLLHAEHLLKVSADTTLMARLQSNYPKKAEMIKSQTTMAQSRITAIQGNSSHPADWMQNCHAEGAHMQLKHQCKAKEFLPKMQANWNDKAKGAEIQKKHQWTEAQFAQEKGVLDGKIKDLNNNKTLGELCVKLPKGDKGKGDKGGKGDKPDGKDGKDAKGPDGKPTGKPSQKGNSNAGNSINGVEAVRGGLFALALSLVMAVAIL